MNKPPRPTVVGLRALTRLARADILGDVDILACPEGKTPYQRPRLGPPEVPSEGAVVAFTKDLGAKPPACGDTKPVR